MSQPSKVTQTTKQELSPEQQKLINSGLGLTEQVTGGPLPTTPQVPGFTPEQTQAQDNLIASAQTGGAQRQTADNLSSAQNFLLGDVMDVNNNQGLQGAIDAAIRPIQEQFQQVIKPGLNHESIGSGAFSSYAGSRRDLKNNLADTSYIRQVGDTTSGIINDTYKANLDAMTKGVAMAPQSQRAMTFPEQILDAVGGSKRGLQQQQDQAAFEQEMFPFSLGLQLLGAAGATPGGGSTGTVTGAQPNPLQSLLGAVPAALMAFA